jgi:GNAT superfamily N-acetyltransferase
VRKATGRDGPEISAAYLESWRAGYQGLLPDDELQTQARARREKNWTLTMEQSDRVVLVAEDGNGKLIGVAECEHAPIDGRLPWLQMLYVIPSAWGSGAGTALLHAALEEVRAAGHDSAWLEVVKEQTRARRFYEREGFALDPAMPIGSNGLFDLLCYRYDLVPRATPG